ncbi:hypothetical protein ACWGCW_24305 [Streptomyces sp. NPDC054933]
MSAPTVPGVRIEPRIRYQSPHLLSASDLRDNPELILFPCWGDPQDYAAHDSAGRDLRPLVNLVDPQGIDAIIAAVAHLVP